MLTENWPYQEKRTSRFRRCKFCLNRLEMSWFLDFMEAGVGIEPA